MIQIKVKPSCVIYHAGQKYTEGDTVELEQQYSVVHLDANNAELVESTPPSVLETNEPGSLL